jgi:hypothetical protein
MRRLLRRFREWRDNIPERRQLSVGGVFYRLSPWQRAAFLAACGLCVCLFTGPTFSANVVPHLEAIYSGGHFHAGELVASIYLTGAVTGISIEPVPQIWTRR